MWSAGDDLVPNEIFWHGWDGHEGESTRTWWNLATEASVVFDIGAHVGLFSLLAGHANPRAHIYAFEPFPAAAERLKLNAGLNGLKNVHCVRKAAGAENATAQFYYSDGIGIPAESSLRADCTQAFMRYSNVGEIQTLTVDVIALDDFVREKKIPRVDLIKLDTEGTEADVLSGMRETLERDKPDILCEVLKGFDTEQGLEEILAPLGYRFYFLTDNGPQEQRQIVGQLDQKWQFRNYLFKARL